MTWVKFFILLWKGIVTGEEGARNQTDIGLVEDIEIQLGTYEETQL